MQKQIPKTTNCQGSMEMQMSLRDTDHEIGVPFCLLSLLIKCKWKVILLGVNVQFLPSSVGIWH